MTGDELRGTHAAFDPRSGFEHNLARLVHQGNHGRVEIRHAFGNPAMHDAAAIHAHMAIEDAGAELQGRIGQFHAIGQHTQQAGRQRRQCDPKGDVAPPRHHAGQIRPLDIRK